MCCAWVSACWLVEGFKHTSSWSSPPLLGVDSSNGELRTESVRGTLTSESVCAWCEWAKLGEKGVSTPVSEAIVVDAVCIGDALGLRCRVSCVVSKYAIEGDQQSLCSSITCRSDSGADNKQMCSVWQVLLKSSDLRKGRVENSQRNETDNIVAGRQALFVFCTRSFRSNGDLQFE